MAKIVVILDKSGITGESAALHDLAYDRARLLAGHQDYIECVTNEQIDCGLREGLQLLNGVSDQLKRQHMILVTSDINVADKMSKVVIESSMVALTIIALFEEQNHKLDKFVDESGSMVLYCTREMLSSTLDQCVSMVTSKNIITLYKGAVVVDKNKFIELFVPIEQGSKNVLVTLSVNEDTVEQEEIRMTVNGNKLSKDATFNQQLKRFECSVPAVTGGQLRIEVNSDNCKHTRLALKVQAEVDNDRVVVQSKLFQPDFFERTNGVIKVRVYFDGQPADEVIVEAVVNGPSSLNGTYTLNRQDDYLYYHFDMLRCPGRYYVVLRCQFRSRQVPVDEQAIAFNRFIDVGSLYVSKSMLYLDWCSVNRNRQDISQLDLNHSKQNDKDNAQVNTVKGHAINDIDNEHETSVDQGALSPSYDKIQDQSEDEDSEIFVVNAIIAKQDANMNEIEDAVHPEVVQGELAEKLAKMKENLMKKFKRHAYFISKLGADSFTEISKHEAIKQLTDMRHTVESEHADLDILKRFEIVINDLMLKFRP